MKKRATLLFLSLLLAGVTGALRAQVELLPNTPNDQFFCAAHPEPGIVYLAGNQAVYKSSDNGDSWEAVYTFGTDFPSRFFGMWFIDGQRGFATCTEIGKSANYLIYGVSSLPRLFKTVDGGVTWQCIDTVHHFTDVQFVSIDTLFARDSYEGALYKSVNGGATWGIVLAGCELSDFSVVNGNVIYALHETSYLTNEWNGSTSPNPIVYKSSDGGDTWATIRPADSSRGPRLMDQIFFYEDGKGVILGHDVVYTENDFSTYETASAGFPSAPDGWNLQNCTMKSGFQIATSWDDMDMSGFSIIRISRDYGFHSTTIGTASYLCETVGCETDTSFFVVTLNNVLRVKGSDFPNVGVPERIPMALSVYPNPAGDLLHIELSGTEIANVALYDLQGRVVETRHGTSLQSETATVNLRNVPAGVYLLRVRDAEGKEYMRKIVKK